MTRWELFGRGFVMPCLATCNAVTANRGAWPAVFVLSFAISWVWWGTVQASAAAMKERTQAAQFSYALGAGCGGVVGMVLGFGIGRLLA
jgi:hypothetical protein